MDKEQTIKSQMRELNENCVNRGITLTRNLFLKGVAAIYLIAFLSLYFQIQGLWGDEGILPAGILLKKVKENLKENAHFLNVPTFLWFNENINRHFIKFVSMIGLNGVFQPEVSVDNTLYIICLLGIFISLGILLNWRLCFNPVGYFFLWLFYLNFFIIGQVFMSYQWDIFLLETGFITIFLCPITMRKLKIITPIDNLVFHMIRFLMFRFMYSNGIVKVTANCPTWLSFTALHYHFQSQPIPNSLSYFAHFLPDGVKRMLVAETFFIEIYAPFLFFLFFRRFNIFSGCLQFCLQVAIIMTGNYNFFNLLTIVVNLTNFDDEFLRAFIPRWFMNLFDLDPLKEFYRFAHQEQEDEGPADGEETECEGNENETEQMNGEEKIKEVLKNKKLRNIYDNSQSETEDSNNDDPKSLFSNNGMFFESVLFLNFLAVSVLFTFFYIYPMKDLLQGSLKLKVSDLHSIYNQKFLNYYMIFIFVYMSLRFIYDIFRNLKVTLLSSFSMDRVNKQESLLMKAIQPIFPICSMTKYFVFSISFALYFLNTVNVFYNGIDMSLDDGNPKNENFLKKGLSMADYVFTRLRVNHGYGLFRVMTGVKGRPELEVKILNGEIGTWETLNFGYKMSTEEGFSLKQNIPHQPRLDWQIWFASLSKDINTEPWLVIMIGKVLEKNPVTLDLLGYYVEEKSEYYKYSMFHHITNFLLRKSNQQLNFTPKKVKIDLYNYFFNTKSEEVLRERKIWTKKYVKDYLAPIEKSALNGVFQMYDLPQINDKRKVFVSTFQLLPIVDIVILLWLSSLITKLLFKN